MKVGDLVMYGDWYRGHPFLGIVVEKGDKLKSGCFYIMWHGQDHEWEFADELEIIQ